MYVITHIFYGHYIGITYKERTMFIGPKIFELLTCFV